MPTKGSWRVLTRPQLSADCGVLGGGIQSWAVTEAQWPVVVGHQLECVEALWLTGWKISENPAYPVQGVSLLHKKWWAKSQQCGWKTCLTFENCFLLPLLDYTLTIVNRCRNLYFSLVCHCSGPSSNWHIPKVHTLAIDGVWQWYRFKLLPFTSISLLLPHVWWWKPKVLIKHW